MNYPGRRTLPVLAVVALVVTAGCTVVLTTDGDEDITGDWRTDDVVTVAVDATGDGSYRPQVALALGYWEANAEWYAGFPVQFQMVENANDADVVVRPVEEVTCPNASHAVGCAPRITDPGAIDRPVVVQVKRGLSNDAAASVLRHEFGHVLGLGHEDDPTSVMAARSTLTTPSQPNATERALPWPSSDLTVYVDTEATADPIAVRTAVREALAFYARGADGTVPANVSFAVVDDPEAADVVVVARESVDCGAGETSCGTRHGVDPDGDGALEEYRQVRIELGDVPRESLRWHVGYWLGYAFGFDEPSDWAAPFRPETAAPRDGTWWVERTSSPVDRGPLGSHPHAHLVDTHRISDRLRETP